MGIRDSDSLQGVGARTWLLERRNGLPRATYYFGDQRRLYSLLSLCEYSASPRVLGSSPVDPFGWGDDPEDLLFGQCTSSSGQFAQEWKLRMMTQVAALKGVAESELRRLLARARSSNCADVHVGDSVFFL